MSAQEHLTFEQAVDRIGFGWWQIRFMSLCALNWTADAMEILLISFISPAARCEWNLSTTEESLITTILFLGMLLGAWFWGVLSDHHGRRSGFIVSSFLLLFGASLSAYSGSYLTLLLSRAIVGFSLPGGHLASALAIEYTSARYRQELFLFLQIFWCVGSVIEGFLGWYILSYLQLNWRFLSAVSAVPVAITCIVSLFSSESSRYYLAQRNIPRAQALIKEFAETNKYKGDREFGDFIFSVVAVDDDSGLDVMVRRLRHLLWHHPLRAITRTSPPSSLPFALNI
eukprot:TRINITY_DN719_c0_g1_i2.p1 TRINITY_DN719_c0_g1~~TRINITY_DN719_c0_g1_i2.p1  ORF type:complete len:285 (+),score=33.96 TRINITY_DN719_c0_g1_i2:24-878(+)